MSGNGQGTDEEGTSTAERVTMVVSASFTLFLFGFVIFQAFTAPTGVPPQASVTGTQSMPDGGTRVEVRLTNPGEVGLQLATVEVGCTSPPPEVQFQNVPAEDFEIAYVVCPSGTSNPEASVSWWIEA